MRLGEGISELYVDIALTLVVLSVAGILVSSYGNLGRSVNTDLKDYEVPPLALMVDYHGRKYLIIVNYVNDYRELVLMSNSVRVENVTLGPREVKVIDTTSLAIDGIYIISSNYVVRPEVVILR